MTASGLSFRFYNGDGSTDSFDIDIDYILTSHLQVYVDDVLKTESSHYNIVADQVVFISSEIPASGTDNVRIIRVTPKELENQLVDINEGPLQAADMDLMQKQTVLMIQEAHESDDSGAINPSAEYIRYDSTRGMWLASRDGIDTAIGGVADPSSLDEVATKAYVDSIAEFGVAGVPQVFQLTGVANQATYTLTGGANIETEMTVVFIGGVGQCPVGDYTVIKGDPDSTLVLNATMVGGETICVINVGKARYITATSIADSSITTDKLADDAVTGQKIAADTVDTEHLAADSVGSAEIADGAVTQSKMDDDAVNFEKLDTENFTSAPGGSYDRALMVDKDDGVLSSRQLATTDLNDWASRVATIKVSDIAAPTANVSLNSYLYKDSAYPPADNNDLACKRYVDEQVAAGDSSKIEILVDETLASSTTLWTLPSFTWISTDYKFYEVQILEWSNTTDLEVVLVQNSLDYRQFIRKDTASLPSGAATPFPAVSGVAQGNMKLMLNGLTGSLYPVLSPMYPYYYWVSSGRALAPVTAIRFATVSTGTTSRLTLNSGVRVMIYGHKQKA